MSYPVLLLNEQIDLLAEEMRFAEGEEYQDTQRRLDECAAAVKKLTIPDARKRYLIEKNNGELCCPKCNIICALTYSEDDKHGDIMHCNTCGEDYEIP